MSCNYSIYTMAELRNVPLHVWRENSDNSFLKLKKPLNNRGTAAAAATRSAYTNELFVLNHFAVSTMRCKNQNKTKHLPGVTFSTTPRIRSVVYI